MQELKRKRMLFFILYVSFGLVLISSYLFEKYVFVKESNRSKLSIMGILILVFAYFFISKNLKRVLNKIPNNAIRFTINSILHAIPYALIFVIVYLTALNVQKAFQTVQVITVLGITGGIFESGFQYYDTEYEICKEIKKQNKARKKYDINE